MPGLKVLRRVSVTLTVSTGNVLGEFQYSISL